MPPDGTVGTSLIKDYSATGGFEAPLTASVIVSEATEPRSFPDVPPSSKEKEVFTEDPYAMPHPRGPRHARLVLPLGIRVETLFPGTLIVVRCY
jgi:hypothetical protein